LQLKDEPGTEEIMLTKKFGDETYVTESARLSFANTPLYSVKVKFSIADMNYDQDQDGMMDPDNALSDEDMYTDDATPQRGGAQSKSTVNQGRTSGGNINVAPEDSVAPADRPEMADSEDAAAGEAQTPAFATNVNVTISKPGKGAVHVVTNAQDGVIEIENVYYYPKVELAEAETVDNDFARANVYAGPPFSNLDPELQSMLERYLDERGINEQLASFVPDYVEYKEQREYMRWLDSKFAGRLFG
jgi:complement component 1 Q subcomponent-binding protein, mitochondrial